MTERHGLEEQLDLVDDRVVVLAAGHVVTDVVDGPPGPEFVAALAQLAHRVSKATVTRR